MAIQDLDYIAGDSSVSDEALIKAYGQVLHALRQRKIIRTKNIVGDLGERYCQMVFAQSDKLSKLSLMPTNTTDIDAVDIQGGRYSIKTVTLTSNKRTSCFHLSKDHSQIDKRFDYLLVCILTDMMSLHSLYQFDWNLFYSLKSWNNTQRAWYLSLSKRNLSQANKII